MRFWAQNGCSNFVTSSKNSLPMRVLGSENVEEFWVYLINSPVQEKISIGEHFIWKILPIVVNSYFNGNELPHLFVLL
jgi:hypothetical protein